MTYLLSRYHGLIAAGELRADPDQEQAAKRLALLQEELEAQPPRGSTLWKLLRKPLEPPRGLYLWGGVGRGKSMLMDLFYDCVQVNRKRRAHFHEFMLDVHARLREARKSRAVIRSRRWSRRWRGGATAVFRRNGRQQHGRRRDHVALVRWAAGAAGDDDLAHIQPGAG